MSEITSEQFPMQIEVAKPADAREMAVIKFETLVDRAEKGEMELTPAQRHQAEVTDATVSSLADALRNSSEDEYYLVARDEGAVVGFCRMTWNQELRRYQFRQFYVKPAFQGRKIGSKIMTEAIARTRRSPHAPKGIFLFTGDYNKRAQSMYQHWGFQLRGPEESLHDQVGDRMQEWVKMQLDFQPPQN